LQKIIYKYLWPKFYQPLDLLLKVKI
jgi:hypothetical protein